MTDHLLWVKRWILPHIETGAKSLEVRLSSTTINRIRHEDWIIFNERVRRGVADIRKYSNVEDLLLNENPFKILPGHDLILLRGRFQEFFPANNSNQEFIVFELRKP